MEKSRLKIRKIISSRIVVLMIIPMFLAVFWIVGAFLFNEKISLSVLQYNHANVFSNKDLEKKLHKGDKVAGSFISKDNYLGIVIVKFDNFIKPDYRGEDVLEFRIKEKGAKEWYYVNNYRSGVLLDELKFPFGFPPIGHSANKAYEFELKSLYGNEVNAVSVSDSNVKTGHQMSREEIVGSKMRLLNFLYKKLTLSITDLDFLLSSVLYLLPLLFYVSWKFYLERLRSFKNNLPIFFLALLAINLFAVKEIYFGIYLALLSLWVFTLIVNKFESSASYSTAFSLLFLWIITLSVNVDGDFQKINLWAYSLLLVGILQSIYEQIYKPKEQAGLRQFLERIFKFK